MLRLPLERSLSWCFHHGGSWHKPSRQELRQDHQIHIFAHSLWQQRPVKVLWPQAQLTGLSPLGSGPCCSRSACRSAPGTCRTWWGCWGWRRRPTLPRSTASLDNALDGKESEIKYLGDLPNLKIPNIVTHSSGKIVFPIIIEDSFLTCLKIKRHVLPRFRTNP